MATVKKVKGKKGNAYQFTSSCGYDIGGKQIRRYYTWTPDPGMTPRQIERELERQKVLFDEKCKTGQLMDGNIKFHDFTERWFRDYAEKQLKKKTLSSYRELYPRIKAALGHIRLNKLRPQHLLAFYDNLEEAGVRKDTKYRCRIDFKKLLKDSGTTKIAFSKRAEVGLTVLNSITQGNNISLESACKIGNALNQPLSDLFDPVGSERGLSSRTIHHYHELISSILSTAVQWEIINDNPCFRVKAPKIEKNNPRYLDDKQTIRLLDLLEKADKKHRTMVQLLLFTGLRRGELCGLEWDDIDFDHQMINIRRTSYYLPELGVFTDTPKNETSLRSIKAPEITFDILKSYRAWQNERRLQLGDKWHNSRRLFTKSNGEPTNPSEITIWFHNFISHTDLPPISIHSLRHTNATLQIVGGVSTPTIAARLGHSSPDTTTRIYAHAIRSADEAAAEVLNSFFTGLESAAEKRMINGK